MLFPPCMLKFERIVYNISPRPGKCKPRGYVPIRTYPYRCRYADFVGPAGQVGQVGPSFRSRRRHRFPVRSRSPEKYSNIS